MATRKNTLHPRIVEARAAAALAGETSFLTDIPCRRGHVARRWTANGSCAACMREAKPGHKKPDRETVRSWRKKADANRDNAKRRAWRRQWTAQRKAIIAAQKANWQKENAERFRKTSHAKAKRYRERHPETMRMLSARRRATRRRLAVGPTAQLRAFSRYARTSPSIKCYWCGKRTMPGQRHLDHIIPLAAGGADAAGNICVSCPECNMSKQAKLPEEFAGQSEFSLA